MVDEGKIDTRLQNYADIQSKFEIREYVTPIEENQRQWRWREETKEDIELEKKTIEKQEYIKNKNLKGTQIGMEIE